MKNPSSLTPSHPFMRRTRPKTVIERTAQDVTSPRADGGILALMASPHDVTRLLKEWAKGNQSALDALTPLVYGELRRLAASYMRSESPSHTLQPTALVHEAFLRLVGRAPDCENRSQFYGIAAHLMRQILIDHARNRHAKRRSHFVHLDLDGELVVSRERDADLVALDEALERLAAIDPRKARVVELRFFGGLSVQESAEALNVSEVTVRRDWQFAKTWLLRELSGGKGDGT
jgi:RNA polymerase sigma-70 factor, ECF subfamily